MAIVINSTTGEIDLDQTTPGTYVVTYTVGGVSSTQEVTVNALDNAAFSYSASSYAPTDADPTPTITGLTGGTFSGTTGLVINSTTGEIDLSASTVASYTITYDTTSSGSSVCPNTSTQTVEIAVAGIANNYSMSFDGSNDYIDTGDIDITGTKTISFWINAPSGDNGGIFTMGSASSTERISIALWGSNINAMFNASNINRADFTIVDNTWYHVVIVKSTNSIDHIYINGVSQTIDNTTSWSGGVPVASFIGVYSSLYFEGKLDEFAIWNTALTSSQVSEIYNGTGTNTTKDLTTVSGSNLIYWNRMGD